MRLHYHPLSSYSRKTALGVALRGDAVELVVVDALGGGLSTPAYKAISPFGKMPALELDDGTGIHESTSILEYLEERGPRRLIPAAQERLVRHFDRLGDLYLLDPVGAWFWRKTAENREKAETRMGQAWAVWEKQLADGRPFVAGAEITLGDLSAAVAAHYADTEGLPVPDAIRAYRARLEEHPAFAASRDAATPFVEATKPMRPAG